MTDDLRFQTALACVLQHEGGFVNHKLDPGGMTNLGCTKAVWEEWVKRPVTEAEMRALKPNDVAPLYRKKYWDAVRADELPEGVDYIVFDTAINSGPRQAIKLLQSCVGAVSDGVLGPKTLASVRAADSQKIVEDYAERRMSFLKKLPTWDTFGKGWSRRVTEVQTTAARMLA